MTWGITVGVNLCGIVGTQGRMQKVWFGRRVGVGRDTLCHRGRGATTFSKLGVQFLCLCYCTEQNTDGMPSFVDCSLLRNGKHTLHKKVGVVRPIFFFGGGDSDLPTPPVVAPLHPQQIKQTNRKRLSVLYGRLSCGWLCVVKSEASVRVIWAP